MRHAIVVEKCFFIWPSLLENRPADRPPLTFVWSGSRKHAGAYSAQTVPLLNSHARNPGERGHSGASRPLFHEELLRHRLPPGPVVPEAFPDVENMRDVPRTEGVCELHVLIE